MKCTFFCESLLVPTLGVEYMITVLRGNGHEVSTIFDPKGFKAWETTNPTSNLDDQIVEDIINTDCQVLFAYTTTVYFQRLVNIFDLVKARAQMSLLLSVDRMQPMLTSIPFAKTASIICVVAKVRSQFFS